ncbi:hypothetical protein [Paraburkholderia tuberum]|uniref:Uncharacterized protein n=1 Tax=Paraburkholderia tuberum TaxID=157910 RepID=A0A1H1JSU5_9BURK|nr:hypothetical protein [Paraburkholderia tuberum]SDR52982.1 hypothetical protein SAMN05445850_5585 [Paraburkholderia tuberum]
MADIVPVELYEDRFELAGYLTCQQRTGFGGSFVYGRHRAAITSWGINGK